MSSSPPAASLARNWRSAERGPSRFSRIVMRAALTEWTRKIERSRQGFDYPGLSIFPSEEAKCLRLM
jgi:hypothetical protein